MRLYHKNLLLGLHDILLENFFEPHKVAGHVLAKAFKNNKKWGKRDREVVATAFYDIIRWKNRLEFYMEEQLNSDNILKIIFTYLLWSKAEFKAFDEFSEFNREAIQKKIESPEFPNKAIEHAFPQWLLKTLEKELGDNWEKEALALNEQAPTILRVNTLKTNLNELSSSLREQHLTPSPIVGYPHAILLSEKKDVRRLETFKKGWFEIQDASSQLVAPFLGVKEDHFVVDACAGAGGKTLHLAAEMKNLGNILALDIYAWKLKELKNRAERADAHNIATQVIKSPKDIEALHHTADRLLIDAPCSGLGVLKRNPDSKWKLSEAFLDEIRATQANILQSYSKILKVGGQLVYATCSILPSENTQQIQRFLAQNQNFSLVREQSILPSDGYDGFYMALLKRLS